MRHEGYCSLSKKAISFRIILYQTCSFLMALIIRIAVALSAPRPAHYMFECACARICDSYDNSFIIWCEVFRVTCHNKNLIHKNWGDEEEQQAQWSKILGKVKQIFARALLGSFQNVNLFSARIALRSFSKS